MGSLKDIPGSLGWQSAGDIPRPYDWHVHVQASVRQPDGGRRPPKTPCNNGPRFCERIALCRHQQGPILIVLRFHSCRGDGGGDGDEYAMRVPVQVQGVVLRAGVALRNARVLSVIGSAVTGSVAARCSPLSLDTGVATAGRGRGAAGGGRVCVRATPSPTPPPSSSSSCCCACCCSAADMQYR
jgi:hypothetical protein